MTKEQRLLRMVALMQINVDDMEELQQEIPLVRKFKQITNQWLKEGRKQLETIAGDEKDVHEQIGNIVLATDQKLKEMFKE